MQQTVLIVGGSSGLGRKLAESYASSGCKTGIIGRRQHLLEEIQQAHPRQISFLKADISDKNIGAQLSGFINDLGGVDLLIITASVVNFNDELLPEAELQTVAINVTGFTQVVDTVWHYFKQKGNGHIAGVTSIAAARGNKNAPAYHASKSYQSLYLQSLRVKALHENNHITITELVPGYMDTQMGKGDRLFWVTPIDKASHQCQQAIQKKKARAFITKRWWLVYQFYRFLPSFIYNRLVNSKIRFKK